MKKLILAGAVAAMLSACAGVGGMLGGWNPQITALSAKSTELTFDVAISLDASAQSYVAVLDAVGNKTEAERIKAETANLRDEKDKDKYVYRERTYGSYQRSFDISAIDADKIGAEYKNGILYLDLPKKEARQPETKRLEIR